MFSTCSELTPRAPFPDGRMERIMQPWWAKCDLVCVRPWLWLTLWFVLFRGTLSGLPPAKETPGNGSGQGIIDRLCRPTQLPPAALMWHVACRQPPHAAERVALDTTRGRHLTKTVCKNCGCPFAITSQSRARNLSSGTSLSFWWRKPITSFHQCGRLLRACEVKVSSQLSNLVLGWKCKKLKEFFCLKRISTRIAAPELLLNAYPWFGFRKLFNALLSLISQEASWPMTGN